MDLHDYRREYLQDGLRREHLNPNPMLQFEHWMQQAIAADLSDPNAMILATTDADGRPNQRIVLLKQANSDGFTFFTNTHSRKAQAIAVNPYVSLHFPWHPLERQVRVCGRAEALDKADTEAYFLSRPEGSQLAAWASPQSQIIASRDILLERFEEMRETFTKMDISLPEFWGGYRVIPEQMEFWQGGEHRLHDRFEYTRNLDNTWDIQRLAP